MKLACLGTILASLWISCSGGLESAHTVVANDSTPVPTPTATAPSDVDANEKFREPLKKFAGVDFQNFKYPFGVLKNGELDNRTAPQAGTNYSLKDLFFVDVAGSPEPEAVVLVDQVNCGGSCDGGAVNILVYASGLAKTNLIGEIAVGSRAGGCSLKSLAIDDRKFHIKQFGRCAKNTAFDDNFDEAERSCKFCSKCETSSTWSFDGNRLKRRSVTEIDTPEINIMNYGSQISIN
jgi:hypothetical protein